MRWINPFKLARAFKRILDAVVDSSRLSDPLYVESVRKVAKMADNTYTHANPNDPNLQPVEVIKASSNENNDGHSLGEVGFKPAKIVDQNPSGTVKTSANSKSAKDPGRQIEKHSGTAHFYMPQIRNTKGEITKVGDFEFSGNWVNIPYVIVQNDKGHAFLERLGVPLDTWHDAKDYQRWGLTFDAAESLRWAFIASVRKFSYIETRLVERRVESSYTAYEIENIDVYKCAMWDIRRRNIIGNGVAERAIDLYRGEKTED